MAPDSSNPISTIPHLHPPARPATLHPRPKVFSWNGYRFHFYSEEGDPREPVPIHIRKGRDNAKFWLHPEVVMAYNRGFPPHVLTQLVALIEQNRELIEGIWNDHFS